LKSISTDIMQGRGAAPRGFTTADIFDNMAIVFPSTPKIFLLFL